MFCVDKCKWNNNNIMVGTILIVCVKIVYIKLCIFTMTIFIINLNTLYNQLPEDTELSYA